MLHSWAGSQSIIPSETILADKPLLESDLESTKAPGAGASSWAEHVAGSASSKSGMKLRFIKSTVEDSKIIVTPPRKWKRSVLRNGKIV